jgi:hypothetical protein
VKRRVRRVELGRRFAPGEDLVHLVDAAAPDQFVLVEQPVDRTERLDVTPHQLFSSVAAFVDQLRTLQDPDVFLHRREAHRVARGQRRHGLVGMEHQPHDVAAGGIGQRMEQPIDAIGIFSLAGLRTYNHLVVRYPAGSGLARISCRISPLSRRGFGAPTSQQHPSECLGRVALIVCHNAVELPSARA